MSNDKPITEKGLRDSLVNGKPLRQKIFKKSKEAVKQPAANSLSKQRIEKLFRMFCISKDIAIRRDFDTCSGCVLREIPWVAKDGKVENLCHAIWQEGVLNG